MFKQIMWSKEQNRRKNIRYSYDIFPQLDIESNSDLVNYDLHAFVVHLGSQSNKGHYITYLRNLKHGTNKNWNLLDYGMIINLNTNDANEIAKNFAESETPYMLFYVNKAEKKLDLEKNTGDASVLNKARQQNGYFYEVNSQSDQKQQLQCSNINQSFRGPCGGKTTGLVYIQEKMREYGFQVFIVPEAATLIANGGGMLCMDKYNKTQQIAFQTNLLKLQIRLENVMVSIANLTKKNSIILCDRGLMDGSAYMDSQDWKQMLDMNSLNEVLMRDDRYDLVLHLVTAAVGAKQFYNQRNSARHETVEEAERIDQRTQQAWLGHPNHQIIDNNAKNFEEKLQKMLKLVKKCVGIEASEKKYTRKFLLKQYENLVPNLPSDLITQRFFIDDIFLDSDKNVDKENRQFRKIRKRGQNQNYVYILSAVITQKQQQQSQIQYKKLLSYKEYALMLSNADPKRNNLLTIRNIFMYQNNRFMLDTYLNVKEGFSILKVLLESENQKFQLPPFLDIVSEVTNDQGYKRSYISKKDWYFSQQDEKLIQKKILNSILYVIYLDFQSNFIQKKNILNKLSLLYFYSFVFLINVVKLYFYIQFQLNDYFYNYCFRSFILILQFNKEIRNKDYLIKILLIESQNLNDSKDKKKIKYTKLQKQYILQKIIILFK
ncbi:hypothetical protein IMG5_186910 [Ichthyophthirius multifiliis]|uniref:USP domain-containing protein n=1 Tax=Ichthyophthirius multifiliis TaxID=5932 RepID=G0R3P7_ICHMU|nr:hypothetical protein IMG5_186910 [Ichthyophthirius multifiliis]EGR27902.1 hypothetical protein IMG5_186910 [Ichthyophthirius multifiliis]|eukprot:XP_004027247.1 hypothetical protein IMG5_186910 [Ichthyophthirius multifiliis]